MKRRPVAVPDISGPLRAFAYLRVSTGRQKDHDLSIPDQRKQAVAYCAKQGWDLVAEYVEAGTTGTTEDRPEFQKMIDRACDDDHPVDAILVHSFSRLFRDAFGLEMYVRKLARYGVRVASITQVLGDDPTQVMMRQIIALFDEYQSKENGKHVLRAMKENARQGYYNGSAPPLGYTTTVVETRGDRAKKKLVIDAVEAETVKLIFRLYLRGDGRSGPLGLKATACWLNEHEYRTRRGARFGQGTIHTILTNRVYVGEAIFNKRSAKTLLEKPVSEHVVVDVPPIIDQDEFDAVAATLKNRDPKVSAPRTITGPILLTGLARCATCDGAMTLRTGTSKSGLVHKYYACSTCARKGKTACKGQSIPMSKLDALVTDHLVERLLRPERLTAILASVVARRAELATQIDTRVAALQTQVAEAELKLKRLYRMVEDGVTDLDDTLKDRLASIKHDRDRSRLALEGIRPPNAHPAPFEPEAIARFSRAMRENITSGEIPFRKAYIQSVVDRIEVDDGVIRILGSKATLEQAIAGRAATSVGVRSFERKWRPGRESNP